MSANFLDFDFTTCSALSLLIPFLYACATGLTYRTATNTHHDQLMWRLAERLSLGAWVFALALAVLYALERMFVDALSADDALSIVHRYFTVNDLGIGLSTRLDVLTIGMLLLVTFIGWIIVRYSNHYMAGEMTGLAARARYLRWLLWTLVFVSGLVQFNHLLMIALAWIATSLTLHQLLMFYPNRLAAATAAHKKFLVSRLADIALLAALLLLGQNYSLELDQLANQITTQITTQLAAQSSAASLPTSTQIAVCLLALTAMLKCAQLPFHGWLIQVMEAPTPVSALLHAGIVNIGGFVLIRCAQLLDAVPVAQTILLIGGSVTAVLAAMVMTTRISIKVMLAWSTCAQMGFMLMECALGAYDLAFLHLLAHSLYKAYAFLNAGTTVYDVRVQQQAALTAPSAQQWLVVSLLSFALCGGLLLLMSGTASSFNVTLVFYLILALALPSLFAPRHAVSVSQMLGRGALGMITLSAVYTGWHTLFAFAVPSRAVALPLWQIVWLLALFGGLFLFNLALQLQAQSSVIQRLMARSYPHIFAGFYLDELFTRLTFLLWPMPRQAD